MQEKEKNIRRLAEKFFRLPEGSLNAQSAEGQSGQDALIDRKIVIKPKDLFAAADIHDCDRILYKLRGER